MNPRLKFTMQPKQSNLLIMGKLTLFDNGRTVREWQATSGCPRHQSAKSYWTRGTGLIPPSLEIAKRYGVVTEILHSDDMAAVGEHMFSIWPRNVWSRDLKRVRKGLAVHFDQNHATSPGSGGCIVFVKVDEWEDFKTAMAHYATAGVKDIPLEVAYS